MIFLYAFLYFFIGCSFVFATNMAEPDGWYSHDWFGLIFWPLTLFAFGVMFWVRLYTEYKDKQELLKTLQDVSDN